MENNEHRKLGLAESGPAYDFGIDGGDSRWSHLRKTLAGAIAAALLLAGISPTTATTVSSPGRAPEKATSDQKNAGTRVTASTSPTESVSHSLSGAAAVAPIVGSQKLLGSQAYAAGQWTSPAQIFEKTCALCHDSQTNHNAPMLYGLPLPPDIVKHFVRHGAGPMPAFKYSEINDDELTRLAAWLSAHPRPAPSPNATGNGS